MSALLTLLRSSGALPERGAHRVERSSRSSSPIGGGARSGTQRGNRDQFPETHPTPDRRPHMIDLVITIAFASNLTLVTLVALSRRSTR